MEKLNNYDFTVKSYYLILHWQTLFSIQSGVIDTEAWFTLKCFRLKMEQLLRITFRIRRIYTKTQVVGNNYIQIHEITTQYSRKGRLNSVPSFHCCVGLSLC